MCYFSGIFCNFGSKFNTFIYFMIRKSNQLVFGVAIVLAFGGVSCSKNVYDENRHHEIIKYVSPVDSVDQKHTWQLANHCTYSVSVNAGVGAQRLELYSQNPVESANAELMARAFVKDGQQVVMSASVPAMLTTIYGNDPATAIAEYFRDMGYKVSGRNLSLASRIQIVNKLYGTSVLVSQQTYEIVKDYFTVRDMGMVQLLGLGEEVQLYELLAEIPEKTKQFTAHLDFELALEDDEDEDNYRQI